VLPAAHHEEIDGFRWRSDEITRIEGFSDAVFGFAVTLLIVSLEVPRTSTELLHTMRGFGAFVVTFLMLASMWYAQHIFFRRYGLKDRVTVVLNLVLLFTVLFFVYPLKFLFTNLLAAMMVKASGDPHHAAAEAVILPEHRAWIFLIFGAGFTAVFALFTLLYRHAYKKREILGLNEFEIYEMQYTMKRMMIAGGVGLSYFAIAAMETMPHRTRGEKGLVIAVSIAIFAVLGVLITIMLRARAHRKRVARVWESTRKMPDPPRS